MSSILSMLLQGDESVTGQPGGLCFSNGGEDEGRRGTEKGGDRASDSPRPLLHPRTLSFPSEEKATSRARLTACVRVGPSWI